MSRKEALATFAERRAKVAKAKDVVIVGAGPVGLELFGEIKMANPNANVTIIHRDGLPLSNDFNQGFRQKLKTEVQKRGGKFMFNESVVLSSIGKEGGVKLENGNTVSADISYFAAGAIPNGDLIESLSPALYNPETHSIRVKDTLQVANDTFPNIFVVGDAVDMKEVKQLVKAQSHAGVVANNIKGLLKGQKPTSLYKPVTIEMAGIPFGKSGGLVYLPFFGGFMLGDWAAKNIKGKDLFVTKNMSLVVRN